MRARQTIAHLAAFAGRGPGTDAERRAALWLAAQLRESGAEPRVQTFWCRPNWAAAQAWHVALALAGSLVAVADARVGLAIAFVALALVVLDAWRGISLGRRLTPERASQDILVSGPTGARSRLLIVANYDAGRTGVIYGPGPTALRRRLRRITGGGAPGWLAWLALVVLWIVLATALRTRPGETHLAGVLAVVPTALLVIALAALLEAAVARPGPAAGDNASGTAVALALYQALAASPPRHLAVELVLRGAHEGSPAPRIRSRETIVLALGACAAGTPGWSRSDGPLLPHAAGPQALAICRELRDRHAQLGLAEFRSRSWPLARGPHITLGAADSEGLIPRSHRPDDVPEALDPAVPDRVLELALLFVDALDARLTEG